MKKQIPNIITVTRFLFSIGMIFTQTFSVPFFVLYTLGGVTDALDGFLARKLDACSKSGALLDSIADVLFFVISLIKILCAVSIPMWLIICLLFIAVLKIVNLIIGFVTQYKLVMPHTIPNKITGFLIFLVPYALLFLDISYVTIPVCVVAVFAAVHEEIVVGKKYATPLLLVLFMILNIICAIVFRNWIFMFVASQLILFHLVPPFAVLLSVIAYKKKLGFWFKQNSIEKNFYKKIKVKQWKDKFPTYDSKLFTINSESKEGIIKAMIQSENVHLLLVFFSFIPLLLSKYYGHFGLMFFLCVIFSAIHIPFVIIQRFNLPRIIKLPN